jgi:catechol 2,3-dioxygenase-like lactoylglutathione lyase family enzyme
VSGLHHQGMRVTDLERAVRFYVGALGARPLTRPVELNGRGAEQAMDGPPGTRFRLCFVGFADGSGIELFEFPPGTPSGPPPGRLPHLGIEVDDVDAALERVERFGGARLWPAPGRWGKVRVVYVADPDGTVLELLDGPLAMVAEQTVTLFPEAAL